MSSTFTVHPSQLLDNSRGRAAEPRNPNPHGGEDYTEPSALVDSSHLSAFSPSQPQSNWASPGLSNTGTPAESISALSINYQSSEFSELDNGDPFFGIDFSNADSGGPSFLDDSSLPLNAEDLLEPAILLPQAASDHTRSLPNSQGYPLSPEQTPSLHTTSPLVQRPGSQGNTVVGSVAGLGSFREHDFGHTTKNLSLSLHSDGEFQLTPDTSGSGRSSEDGLGLVPGTMPMPGHSPRVTVSMWGRDDNAISEEDMSNALAGGAAGKQPARPGLSMDDSYLQSSTSAAARDEQGNWIPDAETGHRGLDPSSRPSDEVSSVNELAARRDQAAVEQNVSDWLSTPDEPEPPESQGQIGAESRLVVIEGVSDRGIALGNETENVPQPGRTYIIENGSGPIMAADIEIMRRNRNWEDAPAVFSISGPDESGHYQPYQPETSQAAIEQFERMCRDNASIVSRAATWGTRRRSLPSISDIQGITSGNFLKKLSISRDTRRPSIFKEFRHSLMRKTSANQLLKRSRSNPDEENSSGPESGEERRDSKSTLAPPTRTMSWGKKQPVPSINTALISMASSVASIGTTHARSGSISTTTPTVTSPKSPFALKVGNSLRRPRSKSDLPKPGNDGAHSSSLADMWKRAGGPPVASLAKTSHVLDPDDDDDDEDDGFDDAEVKVESKMIEDITPNFAGFQQHVLRLNPMLGTANNYLVDRIAHQQIIRYKSLLSAKVKHIKHVQDRTCQCGDMCIDSGGSAKVDNKFDPNSVDPLSSRFDGSEGDISPLEGAIGPESFPTDIPMPPTKTLPAEFECQLCYQAKKFQKPSDWTKHVHEDVQPFTCTWDRCRDPKIFKRKADWVRHENEGHRHLEWWTCDVEDCRHTCYRRDNFLQHLVREHKFLEPKHKTKAAIKRAGGLDPTWQKVEKCHQETQVRAQEEPCRFCGKTFPTWKKLTVHLAKHMEQISLPILRLVYHKELDADTIISPVQDPPPRTFAPFPPVKREAQPASVSPNVAQMPLNHPAHTMGYHTHQQGPFGFPVVSQMPFQPPFYNPSFDGLPGSMPNMGRPAGMDMPNVDPGFTSPQAYHHNMPVTSGGGSGGYASAHNPYMPMAPNVEPFPALPMNALGLQDPSGPAMSYEAMMDPSSAGAEHYTPQGSVSPYSHSPHQGPGQFYG